MITVGRPSHPLRWEGSACILVTGAAHKTPVEELFGAMHPASLGLIEDVGRLADWIAHVKKLPLMKGELPPVLAVWVETKKADLGIGLSLEQIKERRALLLEATPLVLVSQYDAVAEMSEEVLATMDIVVDTTDAKGAWRLRRSRYQPADPTKEESDVTVGIMRFYFQREQLPEEAWEAFVMGWRTCGSWRDWREVQSKAGK